MIFILNKYTPWSDVAMKEFIWNVSDRQTFTIFSTFCRNCFVDVV